MFFSDSSMLKPWRALSRAGTSTALHFHPPHSLLVLQHFQLHRQSDANRFCSVELLNEPLDTLGHIVGGVSGASSTTTYAATEVRSFTTCVTTQADTTLKVSKPSARWQSCAKKSRVMMVSYPRCAMAELHQEKMVRRTRSTSTLREVAGGQTFWHW